MDRRRASAPPPDGRERRQGDRRRAQAAVLDHRRDTDRRLDAAGLDVVLQQQAFRRRAEAAPARAPAEDVVVVDLVERTVDLREPEVRLDPCPLCGVLFDRLWLFRHVALEH